MTATVTEQDVAGRVLDLVKAVAGAGVEAEVLVERQELALTRFANSYIHQNVADATTGVRLRVHADGRTASTSTTVLESLDDLVERTVAALRLAPADPGWPGLTPPTPSNLTGHRDEATAQAEPDERAARVRAFVDAAGGLATAGFCSTSSTVTAFANSAGQALRASCTQATMDAIARTPTSDGLIRLAGVRLGDLDGAVLGARAAAKARAGADPVELPPGRYEVVLEPTAVADVLQILALYGFNAKAVAERRSFVELGTAQFDRSITIVDDLTRPDAMGTPFDAEGTPRRPLRLVDAGVSAAVAHDRRTAARAGTESTGHAIVGGGAWGAVPAAVRLVPGSAEKPSAAGGSGGQPSAAGGPGERPSAAGGSGEQPSAAGGHGERPSEVDGPAADSSVAALVAGVERGLLVTDNHYTRVLDPRTLVVTGLTRNGVWLIEHGEITTPVKNFRFTQSYPQALAPDAVLGVGTYAVGLPGVWSELGIHAPALRLASWNYTGGASG